MNQSQDCIVNYREVGLRTMTFASALHEDPNILTLRAPDHCSGRCCVFVQIVKLLAVDLLEAYTRVQTSVRKRMTSHG